MSLLRSLQPDFDGVETSGHQWEYLQWLERILTDDQLFAVSYSKSTFELGHGSRSNLPLNFAIPEKTPATKPL